ncbi:DrmB family protein [Stenotrophomonas bentonitica]
MSRHELGSIRRSAVAALFGPGSVIDFRSGDAPVSAVASGLEEWDRNFQPPGLLNEQSVYEVRLQKKLGVKGFRLPPVAPESLRDEHAKALVAVRFPNWLQCPQCNRVAEAREWADDPGKAALYCPQCRQASPGARKGFVVPVRFVMACESGHIDEFPWHWWVGHDEACRRPRFLNLNTEGPGLAGLILSCPACKARRSMDGVFSQETWNRFSDCRGRKPWLPVVDDDCKLKARALQRGASNLYFPVVESALSIPPWSDRLQDALGVHWQHFVRLDAAKRRSLVELLGDSLLPVMDELGLTEDELLTEVTNRIDSHDSINIEDLRTEEHRQFISKMGDTAASAEFEMRPQAVPDEISPWFSHLVRAVRLREVRALLGFTRVQPPRGSAPKDYAPISCTKLDWLPAIEVRGEGIFLEFDEVRLSRWEKLPAVIERVKGLEEKYHRDLRDRGEDDSCLNDLLPRSVLVHTFAHALMRQLTLDCGYSSTSLRERLYVDENMAGVLIYTATTDEDGTLGGLQREGKPSRIARTVQAAVLAQVWCSSDPLCIEGILNGSNEPSLAACHACVLAPETSCEMFNHLLDRALLVGTPLDPSVGYFEAMLSETK